MKYTLTIKAISKLKLVIYSAISQQKTAISYFIKKKGEQYHPLSFATLINTYKIKTD